MEDDYEVERLLIDLRQAVGSVHRSSDLEQTLKAVKRIKREARIAQWRLRWLRRRRRKTQAQAGPPKPPQERTIKRLW